ncbi:uncharacterized protein LOC124289577 isoform X1 [Haliotis rubra]|uniref:uncharacterized protein LOC124289577 isoform X1 n=2 Tax=Haliotis rubra TaxID=36100 RepID=UPI001EE5AE8E|nr:uncharacterized protein LOC124289577 isoform X1 [Haliotis rubra]XP_046582101.1 uncharacterized protein LOC124289577 isoform X1 [Haliotis rubra]
MNTVHTSARWLVVTVFLINATVITAWTTTTNSGSVYDSINTTPEPLCRSDTCLNGGTCRELEDWECSNDLDVEHTVCLCTPTFTGTRCEYSIKCGGQTCRLNEHCVNDKCVSLTDSAESKAPQCKPGVHPLTYQLDMLDRKKPIVCLDMYYTNASSYCHDKDDSIEFQIVQEEVENLFCLNLDYRLWQTCLHVNATFNKYNFPDKPVSKVTLIAKENDMHPRTDTIVFSVTFNTAPKVEMTSKTYVVNVATQGPQVQVNISKVFGVSDNDTVTYDIRVPHPQVGIVRYTGQLKVNFIDGNEKDISVDIEIKDTGIPKLTTVVTVKIEFLILSCDMREHIYVNYQHIGNPVGKLNCRISKGYDMSDLYIFFVTDEDLMLKLLPDGILKVVKGEYGERNVSMSVNLKGDSGEISVTVSFSITIADIWTGSYELLNRRWEQVYADQRYSQFMLLQSDVTNQMQQIFRTQNVGVTVNVEMFSKSSSNYVNVHFILIFPNGDNSASAVTELRGSIYNGSVGSMRVNETSLIISNRVGSTQVSKIEYSSPDASNTPGFTKGNTEIQLTCTGTFVQPVGDVTMEWRMTSRNALVVPLSNSRLQTNLTSPYEGHYVGTLTAANILFKDSGDFQCSLRDEGGLISSQKMNVLVIPRPVVTLLPLKSVVIRSGEDITISCNLTRPSVFESTTTFHWYQNGQKTVGKNSRLKVSGSGFLNATYFCEGENDVGLGERSQSTTVTVIGAEVLRCDKEGTWHGTRAGSTAEYPCPTGGTAVITRHCGEDGQWLDEDSGQCAVRRLERVIDDIEWIEEGLRVANISSVARAISESTQPNELSSKWIVLSLQALGRLLNLIKGCIVTDSKEETKQFIEGFLASVSNILDSRTVGEWKKLKDTATSPTTVLQLLDRMTDVTTNCLDEGDVFTAESTNIELKEGKTDPAAVESIEFSTNSDSNTGTSKVNLKLDSKTLKQMTADASVRFSSIFYKNISSLLPTGGQVVESAGGATGKNGSRRLVVNSGLLAFNLFPAPAKTLDPPLKMTLIHTDLSLNGEDRMCVYLNTSQGLWDSKGCNVSMSGTSSTECSCGHLTNFAVLMSPDAKQILIRHPLTPAEIACCSVAIVLLVVTVVVYAVTWRYIRSDQGVIVIHICVCLAVALLLLLIGIGRDEFGLCIAFAVAVHFFYMATFFMMLASGLEALWSDSNLLPNRSKLKPLLIGAWGLTVLAVIISCSQLQAYEPDLHCWLSLMGDMKWLFVVPVLLILIVNFVVTGKMIHNHLARRAARLQDDQGKEAKSLHWMCFMIPVLGLSWILGLLTVQDGSDVYDYLFAIINVLQGLIIFITQCIANKHVRKGIASLRRPRDQRTTERELEMDALREDADKKNDARASGAYHYIDNTQRSSGATDLQQYESLEASQHIENVYEDMDRTATQTGLFAKEFSEENQYANEQANPVGGANRMPDPAKSGDGGKLPSDVLYRNIQETERRPMIPSRGNRR